MLGGCCKLALGIGGIKGGCHAGNANIGGRPAFWGGICGGGAAAAGVGCGSGARSTFRRHVGQVWCRWNHDRRHDTWKMWLHGNFFAPEMNKITIKLELIEEIGRKLMTFEKQCDGKVQIDKWRWVFKVIQLQKRKIFRLKCYNLYWNGQNYSSSRKPHYFSSNK